MATEQAGMNQLLSDILKEQETKVFFHRLIGMEKEEETYFENLYAFFDELEKRNKRYQLVQNGLDATISEEYANTMNRYWSTVAKLKEPASKTIIDVTFGFRKTPLINAEVDASIKMAFEKTLDVFRETQKSLDVVKNVYFSVSYWAETILPTLFPKGEERVSYYVFWGEIKRNEAYFLLFLSFLGIKILYLNPHSESGTKKINRIQHLALTAEWTEKKEIRDIPKRMSRTKTLAAKAEKEIHEILHTDTNGIFKPWQFEDYQTQSIPLQTTLEELFILWKVPANLRAGFEVKNKEVQIPNIFAKVSGVPEEQEKYILNYRLLKEAKQVLAFEQVPMMPSITVHKQNIILKNGMFAHQDIQKMKEYDFHHLRASIQEEIMETINEMIQEPDLFHEVGNQNDFSYQVLHTVLKMDSRIVTMLQTFDYADHIPKVVVFDAKKTTWTMQDAILIVFLHKIGFDVIVFTPTGYQNIERFIDKRMFDHHKYENFVFDLSVEQLNKRGKTPWMKLNKWFK